MERPNTHQIFKKFILIDSVEKEDYKKALDEWEFTDLYDRGEVDGMCICTHPIRYEYTITNKINKNELIVGSICVQQVKKQNKRLRDEMIRLEYNQAAEKLKKLRRRCETCNKLFNIDELDHHVWKKECVSCWKKKQPVKVIAQPVPIKKRPTCSACGSEYRLAEGSTCGYRPCPCSTL